MDVGIGTNKAFTNVAKEDERNKIRYSFRTVLLKTVSYMQTFARKTAEVKQAVKRLCSQLNKVTNTNAFCDTVQAE